MKNQEVAIMALVFHHPNRKWHDLFFWHGQTTTAQWYYWTKKLEKKGWIESIWHNHGSYSWTGFKLTELGKKTYLDYSLADIPF